MPENVILMFLSVQVNCAEIWQREHSRTNPGPESNYEPDRESLLEHLEGYVQDGDTILVKASHFMKFEEVVTKLENM